MPSVPGIDLSSIIMKIFDNISTSLKIYPGLMPVLFYLNIFKIKSYNKVIYNFYK